MTDPRPLWKKIIANVMNLKVDALSDLMQFLYVTKVPVPTKSAEINKADTKKQKSSEEKKNSDSKISAEETVTSTENKRETYVIRPGDTLYQISLNRYGTVEAMEQICALNGISANEIIYPGQVIVLP